MKQFDPESIKERIATTLQSKSAWAEILIDSTNQKLIDAVAEEIAELARYAEYCLSEGKWSLARNISSLITESSILNYIPHRKIGAVGNVRISASETFSAPPINNVEFPKYTIFKGGDNYYTSTSEELLTTTDNYIDIPVIEGYPISIPTYVASGLTNEEIQVDDDFIENSEFVLEVNGEEWTNVAELREYGADDKVYKITNKIDFSGIYITFGDGVFGKKLVLGDSVKFTYIQTTGEEGDVLSIGIVDTVESVITDILADVVDIYVTNLESIIGGQDYEDIESIRALAPQVFATGDRAISSDDYIAIILSTFSFVAKCNCWGAYETNIDAGNDPWDYIATEDNLVQITCLTTAQENLSDAQKTTISEQIQPKKSPTDIIQFNNVEFIYMIFNVNARVKDRAYTLSQVRTNIYTDLSETYSFDNLDFFQSIYESDYITLIDTSEGVDNHDTTVDLFVETTFDTPYIQSLTLPLAPIDTSSVRIYVKDTSIVSSDFELIGTDNGLGVFTPEAGYDLTNSSINYTNGDLVINVVSGLSGTYTDYEIKVIFTLVSNNIVLRNRYQFLLFDEANIVTSYS